MKYTKNLHKVVPIAYDVSLGISIVVAIAIGVGLGLWLKSLTGSLIVFWVCVCFGIAAAFLNVYKAFKGLNESLKELEDDPKYKAAKENFDDDDWDEKE
ncbi:AtpZ/AtpI family protein [Campylobacter sp. VBCF_06 NA8]|uniref:AtpZ/AtpI family protein n=1 Tax=unclassified Campylobacter TaxID=2593542 RepID=UPI0022E9D2D3|nr:MULTISPECIES: AtpZ/AtpI family protein [unclassified Campylobacter]MDA3046347.1 AtpZ/AtpI family protein [Campylobacter sp. VBCF_06 NA8]MDA3055282.1 AtpZ/AtpI family protein [Campylobacter sp. VBCF_07 NA4]MDA3059949.1 AtpZ/AtpI family protein [Campylobacter sp. VBCF_02 NA5]MDA3069463.1 AtpZ/AtpI family protein [Campylobacter sp. VBCF_08 NA3]WBR53652.1 AtpZ/AtpI family protein [Campylobacter sp. VBCF_01 NA2]